MKAQCSTTLCRAILTFEAITRCSSGNCTMADRRRRARFSPLGPLRLISRGLSLVGLRRGARLRGREPPPLASVTASPFIGEDQPSTSSSSQCNDEGGLASGQWHRESQFPLLLGTPDGGQAARKPMALGTQQHQHPGPAAPMQVRRRDCCGFGWLACLLFWSSCAGRPPRQC